MASFSGIHDYDKKLISIMQRLENSSISNRNKKLIKDFDRACILEKLTVARRVKLISTLVLIGERYIKKDFDKAKTEDMKKAYVKIESNKDFSVWTKHDYASVMKKFWKWIAYGDDYFMASKNDVPETVRWIRVHIKKKDQPKIEASDILTEEEVFTLIEAAATPRDKAFISTLYETGARISEIGNMKIGDVTKQKYGYLLDVKGKTGARTPIIINAAPYLRSWINMHPLRDNPKSALWINTDKGKNNALGYSSLRTIVNRLKEKAKIKKRIHPHLFRHSRVTHVLVRGLLTSSQAEIYFGWVPGTSMLEQYSHLVSKNANDAMLESLGLKSKEESKITSHKCAFCETINNNSARFCESCGNPLNITSAVELRESQDLEKLKVIGDILDIMIQNVNQTNNITPQKKKQLIEAVEKIRSN
ncbi:MAG: site-specific integrase [Candidatus Aenigmatarchaeota archaeon]